MAAAREAGMAAVTASRVAKSEVQFRKDTVKIFLRTGTPIATIDDFRNYLEEYVEMGLTNTSNMRAFIPSLELEELEHNKRWLAGNDISGCFDGASRLGEVEAFVARRVTDDLVIQSRLIGVQLFASALNADKLARAILETLTVQYQHPLDSVIFLAHDRAAVNGAAVRKLAPLYENLTDTDCIVHTLDNCGCQMQHKELTSFYSILTRMWSQSDNSLILFKRMFGFVPDTESDTRWWSWYLLIASLVPVWHRLEEYLVALQDDGVAAKSAKAALHVLRGGQVLVPAHGIVPASTRNEPALADIISLQAAVIRDFAHPFMAIGYFAEGDGPEMVYVYKKLLELEVHMRAPYLPNLEALKRRNPAMDVTGVVSSIIDPARDYFRAKFGKIDTCSEGALSSQIKLYKLCAMLDPEQMAVMDVSVELLDEWPKALKGIAKYPDLIPGLKSSLAAYKAACLELPGDFDLLRWWRLKKKDLPFWAQLLRIVLLLAPSSAAVERVFSIMRRTFGKDQDKALGDMIRTSLMLQYNYRNHSRGRAEDRRASFL